MAWGVGGGELYEHICIPSIGGRVAALSQRRFNRGILDMDTRRNFVSMPKIPDYAVKERRNACWRVMLKRGVEVGSVA